MNQFDHQWRKLIALARQAEDSRDATAPYGFGTRVAACAGTMPFGRAAVPVEKFALRALLVAAAFGVAAIAVNFTTFVTSTQTDAYVAADVVGDLLDLS